ncbi:isoprenyl transferase [Clostridium sp. CAG:273]|nr:isoprenyl transferase [Clostridium sp. CAG:273]
MIRPGGEKRISNFLPWQLSYTEFIFTDKYWPDFNRDDLDEAILEYERRNRKFGAK